MFGSSTRSDEKLKLKAIESCACEPQNEPRDEDVMAQLRKGRRERKACGDLMSLSSDVPSRIADENWQYSVRESPSLLLLMPRRRVMYLYCVS